MDSIKRGELILRKVRLDDKDLLHSWSNDPVTRKHSFNSDSIPYEAHEKWFANTLSSDSRLQFILEKSGVPIGQIRLDIEDEIGEIGYSIAPEYRGNGYGNVICNMLIEYSRKYLSIKKIIAQVKTDNIASKKCFIKNGFQSVFEQLEIGIDEES